MSWNYRILQHEGYCAVHGVYYADDGSIAAWSAAPDNPIGNDPDDLKGELANMMAAFGRPLLKEQGGELVAA